jgi:galactose mutarotase-like enzyme
MGYFSPCGYVAPAFYDDKEDGFLKSFTAGFLTTCGLRAVGAACEDEGERLPVHGTIANTPAETAYWEEVDGKLVIHAVMKDERIFTHKLVLRREIICSLDTNELEIHDIIENRGDMDSPAMIMYHMNLGYPLLSENAILRVNSDEVIPRDPRAAEDLDTWNVVIPPQKQFAEQCYFHKFSQPGVASLYNPDVRVGVAIHFDPKNLTHFTQWKMMGERDYVLGLEPGNCHPNGRHKMREEGTLTVLKPGESVSYVVKVEMLDEM